MRILIAEDHNDLRELLAELLIRQGHAVTMCEDGEEALREYITMHGDGGVDYVISDYQMPRKNGVMLIMDIRRINPQQPCILVSGDPPTLPDHIRKMTGEFPVLRKPYDKAELIALLT